MDEPLFITIENSISNQSFAVWRFGKDKKEKEEAIKPHSVFTGKVLIQETLSWRWALTQGNMVCAEFCSSEAKFHCSKSFFATLAAHIHLHVGVCFLFLPIYMQSNSCQCLCEHKERCVFVFLFVFLSNQHHHLYLLHVHKHRTSMKWHESRISRDRD